jgi:integrase/recombinase XerD
MATLSHPLIERFLEAQWFEKGLSAHTRAAYRSDLEHFNAWLDARGLALAQIGREALLDHLA